MDCLSTCDSAVVTKPRVAVIGLASCFGCQVQMTNIEQHLLDVLGQIDLEYWQLTTTKPMPVSFDVALIEGAVTTEESRETVLRVRKIASCVIAIGSCATLGGVPGLLDGKVDSGSKRVYGDALPAACGSMIDPRPVSDVIPIDFEVRCCPIDPFELVEVLQKAIYGSNKTVSTATLCGECKRNGSECFYTSEKLCLGMVTMGGCKARCVNLGRPCNGCRGLSPDANLASACEIVVEAGLSEAKFLKKLELHKARNKA